MPQLDLDSEKWEHEIRWRDRELELRAREIATKEAENKNFKESKWSKWSNPLVIAVLGAAVATGGNAVVAYINGSQERELETVRFHEAMERAGAENLRQVALQEESAEDARVLELVKSLDPNKATANLKFLINSGLIKNPDRRRDFFGYLYGQITHPHCADVPC